MSRKRSRRPARMPATQPPPIDQQADAATSEQVARPQAGAERRRQRAAAAMARRRRARLVRLGMVAAVLVVVVTVGWLLLDQSESPPGPGGLPGPLGGPEIAQDVNTLVGKPAPAFTLTDSEGQSYTVTPGQDRPIVLVSHMGITWQLCVEQLGELQQSVESLTEKADIYVVNSDTPEDSRQLKEMTGISVPVLLDHDLTVAGQYDLLPKSGQPMGGMTGVGQMGFVIIDARGTVRMQRVDVNFGDHSDQMLEVLGLIEEPSA